MKSRRQPLFILGFLAPAVIIYLWFVVVPVGQTAWMSMFLWKGLSIHRTFVGGDNFVRLAADSNYRKALSNMAILLVVALPSLIGIGVGIAHWLVDGSAMSKIARKSYLLPHVISLVVVATIWEFLLNPSIGLVNSGLDGVGLHSLTRAWLGDPGWALPSVILAFVWYNLGFYVMLFTAGIQMIPGELKEAAELDGSSGWHRFVRVTWPLLWSVKKVAASYIVINVMNTFALVYLMTAGGPDRATEMPLTYLYERGFGDSRFGDAATIGLVNLFIALLLSGLAAFVFRKDPTGVRA